jgi:hypothetical protein
MCIMHSTLLDATTPYTERYRTTNPFNQKTLYSWSKGFFTHYIILNSKR